MRFGECYHLHFPEEQGASLSRCLVCFPAFQVPKEDWKTSASLVCDENLHNPQEPLPDPQDPLQP